LTPRSISCKTPSTWHTLGITRPKVEILSAVETVTSKLRSSMDAAALSKLADRGPITDHLVGGALAFDNAVSAAAAKTQGIVSEVAGKADILVVPDLESGNMLTKQLEYLGGAQAAGIVKGAKVPIVLTSRAGSRHSRHSRSPHNGCCHEQNAAAGHQLRLIGCQICGRRISSRPGF